MEVQSVSRKDTTHHRKVTIVIEGFDSEENATKALEQLLHPELRKEVLNTGLKFTGGKLLAETILCCHSDGNTYWCTTNGGLCWPYCDGCIA
jgi:hypothetical protein